MSRTAKLVVLGGLMVVAAVVVLLGRSDVPAEESAGTGDGVDVAVVGDGGAAIRKPEGRIDGPAPGSVSPDASVRHVEVPADQLLDQSASSLALSPEEAAWLSKNGYPSAWELQHLELLDWELVRRSARSGDEVAQNLLAERLLASGDAAAAAAMFGNPRGMASIYAMVRSAEIAAGLGRFPREEDNFREFMLHAEYARLMGDHQIDRVIQRVLPATVDQGALQQEVLRALPDFARSRFEISARTGLPAPNPSVRPNQEQWRLIQAGNVPVQVVELPSPYSRDPRG